MPRHETNDARRGCRAFSLIEIVVAVAIIAMLSGAVAVAVIIQKRNADISLTTSNAEIIRGGVDTWWMSHGANECPTVKELVADGALKRGKSAQADAWGQPWRILCDVGDATVISRGPDKTPDTEDDIRVPPS
jgi:prepilin-type N-terminal cleavage/methylation domain-containing protein